MAELSTIYTRFNKAREAQYYRDFLKDLKIARRTFKGEIFDSGEIKKMEDAGIPEVRVLKGTTNTLRLASILTASRPELKALPIGSGDGAIATIVGRAYKKIWDGNIGNAINHNVVVGLIRDGLDHFNVTTEKYGLAGDVRILIKKLGAKKVVYDPDTPEDTLEDWSHRFVFQAISPQQAKDLHHLKDNELYYEAVAEQPEEGEKEGDHDSEIGGKYEDDTGHGGPNPTKKTVWEFEYWERRKYSKKLFFDVATEEYFERFDNTTKDNQSIIERMYATPSEMEQSKRFIPVLAVEHDLRMQHVVGSKIISDTVNPYGKDELNLPIDPVILVENIRMGILYPRGNMFLAHWPLKEISKRRGQSIAVVSFTMGSPIIAKEGTIDVADWKKKVSKPREILTGEWEDASDKPTTLYQQIPDLSRVFMLEDRANADLNDVFNLTPILKGEAETGRMSGRLAAMLKEFGMEGNSYLITALEAAFRKLGVCLIAIALKEWPFHYWQRLIEEEDYDPETQQLTPDYQKALETLKGNDVSIIDYDVGVRSGSSLPINRAAKVDMSVELASTPVPDNAIYDAEAVLHMLDDPQAKQVLKRRSKVKQLIDKQQAMLKDMEQMANQLGELDKDKNKLQEQVDKMKIGHVEDMGKQKWRYEVTIEKMNMRIDNLKDQLKEEENASKSATAAE